MLRVLLLLFQLAGGLPSGDPEGSRVFDGDPVDLYTGLYEYSNTDLRLSDIHPIELTRIYRNEDTQSRAFGIGANHVYEMFLVGDRERFSWIDLIDAGGSRVHFERTSPGTSWENAEYIHTSSPSSFYGATLRWNRQ